MKIGIMTFFRPINFGAFLQAYALSQRLNQDKDIEAEIINFHMPLEDEQYKVKFNNNLLKYNFNRIKFNVFRESLNSQKLSQEECFSDDIQSFVSFVDGKYDVIICGSDEIWKVDGFRGFPSPYFLPGELHCKKVSYAASGRTLFGTLSLENQSLLKKYLNDFEYIGVRDYATYNNVKAVLPHIDKVHMNYDPTFVFDFKPDREKGKALIKKYFGISGQKKIIAVMYREDIKARPNLGRYLQKRYGNNYNFISLYDWNMALKNCPNITPFEWIDLIASVDGVISMYYHGICFAIITGTPFFAVEKWAQKKEESKLYDLMEKTDSLDNYSPGVKNMIEGQKLDDFMSRILKGWRYSSSSFLTQARQEFKDFISTLGQIE